MTTRKKRVLGAMGGLVILVIVVFAAPRVFIPMLVSKAERDLRSHLQGG